MIEKREKLCYGVDGLRDMKAKAGHRGWSYILGPGNAAILPYHKEITKSSEKEEAK